MTTSTFSPEHINSNMKEMILLRKRSGDTVVVCVFQRLVLLIPCFPSKKGPMSSCSGKLIKVLSFFLWPVCLEKNEGKGHSEGANSRRPKYVKRTSTYQRRSAWAADWGLEEGCVVWSFGWRSVYSDSSHRSSGSLHRASPPATHITERFHKLWNVLVLFCVLHLMSFTRAEPRDTLVKMNIFIIRTDKIFIHNLSFSSTQ